MKLTAAQKQKRYRENLTRKGRHNAMKAKNRERMTNVRSKLSDHQREQYRKRDAAARKSVRAANRRQSSASFGSKHSLGKAVKRVTRCLPQDPSKKKLVIQAIAQSIGLLGQSIHKRTTRQLSCKLKDDSVKFYCRDDILYQMPGKRDTIVARQNGTKSTHQKRILLYNIREVHQLFLLEHSGSDIARTSFAELRPQYVLIKALMSHRVCVCAYHENINLLLEALAKHVKGGVCSDLQTFTNALVCDESNEACMSSNCKTCAKYFETKVEGNIVDFTITIKWLQWTNNNGRAEKQEFEGTVKGCVQHLSGLIQQYLLHVFIKRAQSSLFERLKENTDDRKVLLQVDYAENFAMDHQDAIQSSHWNTKTLSIFTVYAWCEANSYSFALASDNVTRNKYCVDVCLNNIISKLKQYLPDLEEIVFFSDGAASQYKQRYLLQNCYRPVFTHKI
ncbi:unnamed protein product [Didymodactylos carnosus]|uniref:Uncharacterized protein n=1 Tax=Didymodactylos carnosus TaxID=1234261 RepID=A0A815FXP9_9BILA|nr:unnamed protein product [Didymodactylos carnosus]CAF1331263.1 unnamed protein product [Didymodactylos carnosus]CAF3529364.1 unnamed protein product [Didymodactylos carnosus]CAF4185008.1 unnamed protein product [Didymodactylos carnosus]